ncbi:MAG: NAD(P)-dependent dehydrogenase (short-subunit alcohol dehydrogenase family) [Candidatus Azotimanducaceae bacterium]|jgi:xanthoxin dehydrogenase
MTGRLENKVVAITGAASGFGEAAAIRFVAEGAKVVLGDIQEEAGQKVAASLGDAAVFVKCNVTLEDDVANLVDTAVAHFGRLDVMYNNAGIVGAAGPIADTVTDEWKFTIDILLNGVYYGCKHAARVMIPQGSGSIVSMSSTAGLMGGLGPHAYATAKHAVIGLTKNVACELAQYGIRANAISPAGMATPMVAALQGDPSDIEATKKTLAAASPLKGRAGVADDVVNAALWLASDESGYTTGHTLTTDAGITIGSNNATPFPERQPIIREAGKRGLDD